MGNMDWNSAVQQCLSIGMRLPIRSELIAAYNSGVQKMWDSCQNCNYWSDPAEEDFGAYYVSMANGQANVDFKKHAENVRCIR